jgi:hypothetical protein
MEETSIQVESLDIQIHAEITVDCSNIAGTFQLRRPWLWAPRCPVGGLDIHPNLDPSLITDHGPSRQSPTLSRTFIIAISPLRH